MSRKAVIMIGMTVGSIAGGFVASKLGVDALSFTSLLASSAGGILGIWIAFKIT